MLNLLFFFFFWGGVKYGNNYINHKQLEPELNGTRDNITVKRKSLHDNKRRCYIGNKRFRLAMAKFRKKISNFVSFLEAMLHVVFLESLDHLPTIIHDRLGQPIIPGKLGACADYILGQVYNFFFKSGGNVTTLINTDFGASV